jgi:hypothetical protein
MDWSHLPPPKLNVWSIAPFLLDIPKARDMNYVSFSQDKVLLLRIREQGSPDHFQRNELEHHEYYFHTFLPNGLARARH